MSGTSTLHDWMADVTKTDGYATLTLSNGSLTGVSNMTINMDARTIKSSKGATMDKNMYKTLKAEQHPTIKFVLSRVISVSGNVVKAEGKLTIAGTTKTIILNANAKKLSDSEWAFSGSTNLKMTDFNVEPPVMMLGALKTDDNVKITFETTFLGMTSLSQK
jgi:polyisoprenoid-binding protein YceI